MKFGPVPIDAALGAILAHSLPALGLRKGRVIDAVDLAAMQTANLSEVVVARLEDGDIDEDHAALTIAQALAFDPLAQDLSVTRPTTGRVNLVAQAPGILRVDPALIDAANAVDPAITIATLPQWYRVEPGDLIATIKIIPYAVASDKVADAIAALGPARAGGFGVATAKLKTAHLIETYHTNKPARSKGAEALTMRLERLGLRLEQTTYVQHDVGAISGALNAVDKDIAFILTASATSDLRDTAPAAVIAAGGSVEHFGMPVDPGNLLFLACRLGRPIIGLPGCARSPALNGADWVLERICCGVPVTARDIMGMGVGGLLKEIPSRPRPRRKDA